MVMGDNARGAVLMMASMACFVINDALMKALSVELPFFEAVFLRGVATTILLLFLARGLGQFCFSFGARNWRIIGLRTVAEVTATYFFINALFHMPLANITAILQALPLTVALAGALFLREPLGWPRLAAILVGFVGVLLIVRPGPDGFNPYAAYALIAVVAVTLRDLVTRKLPSEVPSLSVAFLTALGITIFAGLGMLQDQMVAVSWLSSLQLLAASVFILGGYVFSVMVMRAGEIGFVAPFRYTSLLWALLLGFLFFAEWPDPLTLAGAGIVTATGVFALYREHRIGRRAQAAAEAVTRPR